MTTRDHAEAIATERLQIIAPLVDEATDAAQRPQVTTHIVDQTGLSARTLRWWVTAYQAAGLAGLRPPGRPAAGPVAITPAVLDAASQLRREAPHRSVRQIIQVLEWEGQVAPGTLKRSTLQEQLTTRGVQCPPDAAVHRGGRGRAPLSAAAPQRPLANRSQIWSPPARGARAGAPPHVPVGHY